MAQAQKSLLKSSSSIGNIQKSLGSFGTSLRKANSSSSTIIKSLYKGNRDKKRSILKQRELFEKRREAVRRREKEDVIESGKVGSVYKRTSKVISGSTKGFLGRIMDFVGTIMVGWLVTNLPTIIKGAEELIGRMQGLFSTLSSWTDGIGNFFNLFTSQLGGILSQNKNLNIDSERKEEVKAETGLLKGINKMLEDMEQMITDLLGFNLFQVLGITSDEPSIDPNAPPGGDEYGPGGGEGAFGSEGSGGGGRWKPLLDVIGSAEGGYTSIAPGDSNPDLTRMTIAQAAKSTGLKGGKGAIGRYQLTSPLSQAKRAGLGPNDIFSPANQDKIAIQLIKERGGDDWLRGKITTDRFALKLAQEWAGLPKDSGGRSFYAGDGRNAARVSWGAVMAALKKVKEAPAQTSTPGPTPGIDQSFRYRKDQSIKVGDANAVITSLKGWRWGRLHSGIDIACSTGLYISLKVDSVVVGTKYDANGYGYVIDLWVPTLGVQLRFGHNTKILISSGNIPAGTSFATTGTTGRSTGPHIHFEVDSRRNRTEYKSNMTPDPYVKLIRLTRGRIEGVGGNKPEKLTGIGGPDLENIPTQTGVAEKVTPQREGKTLTIPMPMGGGGGEQPAQEEEQSGGGGGSSISFGRGDELNTFVTKTLLRELEYT